MFIYYKYGFLATFMALGANFSFAKAEDDNILESKGTTTFGSWGAFENCSEGLVTGFQLKVEPKNSLVDDSGLNGIRFFCGRPPASNNNENSESEVVEVPPPVWENVTSKVGIFGNWGRIYNCSTYAVGFDLEAQPPQGKYKDDVGATNLKLLCADGREIEGFHNNGHGHAFVNATYTKSQKCGLAYGICGLQTQVENYQAIGDDTALNNLKVKCCPISQFIPTAV